MMALDARNCLGFEHSRVGPRMVPRTVIGEVGRLSTFVVSIRDTCNRLTTAVSPTRRVRQRQRVGSQAPGIRGMGKVADTLMFAIDNGSVSILTITILRPDGNHMPADVHARVRECAKAY